MNSTFQCSAGFSKFRARRAVVVAVVAAALGILLAVSSNASAITLFVDGRLPGSVPAIAVQDMADRLRVHIPGTASVRWAARPCDGARSCFDAQSYISLQSAMPRHVARKALATALGSLFASWYLTQDDYATFAAMWRTSSNGDTYARVVDSFQVCARSRPTSAGSKRWLGLFSLDVDRGATRSIGPRLCAAIETVIARGPAPRAPPAAFACAQIEHGVYRLRC